MWREMTYPRMEKSEYPPLPKVINSEGEYNLVLEYIVFAAVKIEELQEKEYDPLADEDDVELLHEKREDEQRLLLMMNRYNQLCLMIDDYKQRNKEFSLQETMKHLRGETK